MKNLSTELKAKLLEYQVTLSNLEARLSKKESEEIKDSIKRLEELKLTISAFGETNAGKSALLNSLLGFDNDYPQSCPFSVNANANWWDKEIESKNKVVWQEIKGLELIIQDTPGIGGDFEEHLRIARNFAESSDIILYIVWQTVRGDIQNKAILELLKAGKPLIIVINKIDIQRKSEIQAIKDNLYGKFPELLSDDIFVLSSGHPTSGEPKIKDLVDKIMSIVDYQHSELITNTIERLLGKGVEFVAEKIKKEIEEEEKRKEKELRSNEEKLFNIEEKVRKLINSYAKAASLAAGIIPFGIDAITTTLISTGMFAHILNKYEKKLDQATVFNVGKDLVTAFTSILSVSGITLAGYLAISKGAKTNPFTYFVGMALDAALTYFIVFTIGEAFSHYCKNNLSWGNYENARKAMVVFIRKNLDDFMDRIPDKFKSRIKIDKDKLT